MQRLLPAPGVRRPRRIPRLSLPLSAPPCDNRPMKLVALIVLLFSHVIASRLTLLAENLVLRQQLAVLRRSVPRPKIRRRDRAFYVGLSRH